MHTRRAALAATALAALAAALPSAVSAQAGQGEIDQAAHLIRQLSEQAIRILAAPGLSLEQREGQFRSLLRQGFDLAFIGRFVLGQHWRRLNPQQQADYLELFSEFILKTYARRLSAYSGETLQLTGARAAGQQDVLVRTEIVRQGVQPIVADWRVRSGPQGPRIIDIMVEGISMSVAQRSEFSTVISDSGPEGLLQALRARTEKIGAPAG